MGSDDSGAARGVLRNSSVLAVARVFDRLSALVMVILIAPVLGARGVGVYAAAMAIYGLLQSAGNAGTTIYLIREVSKEPSRTSSYVVHLSIIGAVVALVLTAGLEAVVPHVGYSHELQTSAALISLAVLPTVLNSIQEAAFVAHGRVEFEAGATVVSALLYIVLGFLLLHSHHGIASLMRVYVGLEFAVTAVYFVLINRYIARLHLRFRWSLATRLLRELKAFAATSMLAAVVARPEVVVLSLMASEQQVGYYGVAIRLAELPNFIPDVFMTNLFPLLARSFRSAEQRYADLQAAALRYMLAFSLPIVSILLVTADRLVRLLYGPHFGPAVPLVRILAATLVSGALIDVYFRSLAARGRQRDDLAVQILTVVLRVGGGIALIAPFAAVGAAVANTASSAVKLVLLGTATARSGASTPLVALGWRFALAATLTGAAIWPLRHAIPVWVVVPLGALAYIALAAATRALTSDDWRFLRSLRSARGVAPRRG